MWYIHLDNTLASQTIQMLQCYTGATTFFNEHAMYVNTKTNLLSHVAFAKFLFVHNETHTTKGAICTHTVLAKLVDAARRRAHLIQSGS